MDPPERYLFSYKQERSSRDVPDGEASAAGVMKRLMACFPLCLFGRDVAKGRLTPLSTHTREDQANA
jgi:hypothetical protein